MDCTRSITYTHSSRVLQLVWICSSPSGVTVGSSSHSTCSSPLYIPHLLFNIYAIVPPAYLLPLVRTTWSPSLSLGDPLPPPALLPKHPKVYAYTDRSGHILSPSMSTEPIGRSGLVRGDISGSPEQILQQYATRPRVGNIYKLRLSSYHCW